MANIGSVFLGDVQRLRLLASNPSTPPSSPPPPLASSPPPSSISAFFPPSSLPQSNTMHKPSETEITPTTVDPVLALDLRIRWLEALLVGPKQDIASSSKDKEREKHGNGDQSSNQSQSLSRLAADLQRRFDAVVESNEDLKRFMVHYDQHAHFLTPAFALSGSLPDPPSYSSLSSEQLDALLAEMEPDLRAAERDLREIELLEQKGVTGPGKLASYEELQPRLTALAKRHEDQLEQAASLEQRIGILMERHVTHTDALSELFVAWDDAITMAEDRMTQLELERKELNRLGLSERLPQSPQDQLSAT